MNGVHDMGGMHGFGPVTPESDEPVFHAEWEGRVLAMDLAMRATGEWGVDAARFARESEPPARYLAESYYERWLGGLERLLLERGLVSEEELRVGASLAPGQRLEHGRRRGQPQGAGPPRAVRGRGLRAGQEHPPSWPHPPAALRARACRDGGRACTAATCSRTRAPTTLGEDPQWLYVVVFDGAELWGADAEPGTAVSVDAFEPYLEPAA